uniref:Uncharacterized protein n=1 Tax=Hucho hucho TaxID=62062 RepID=A0A4W5MRS9_9TELE
TEEGRAVEFTPLPPCTKIKLLLVVRAPPEWEVGVFVAGFLLLLAVAGVNLWKLWKSGSFPAPSPFPNFDYRYLQEKYGNSFSEARQKVRVYLKSIDIT